VNELTIGSLFSGIGGLELGFERTGRFKTIWHCEIEPYPSAVLEKNFPGVVNYGDITKVDWSKVERPDVLVGGFPCQDISVAGKGQGIKEGTRSGLWSEYARAIRELRPRYVVVENVAMLARRGLVRVLGDLASLGYDAEWFTIRASDVGAPHRRERLFIIAHDTNDRQCGAEREVQERKNAEHNGGCNADADSNNPRSGLWGNEQLQEGAGDEKRATSQDDEERGGRLARPVEDADAPDLHGAQRGERLEQPHRFVEFAWCENIRSVAELFNRPDIPQPLVRGTHDGVPRGLDGFIRKERTKALGNAVVPQVAQVVAERVLEMEEKK